MSTVNINRGPVFSPPSWSSTPEDRAKNDFQNAVRRNLHNWTRWRIQLNDNLVDAVLTGRRLAAVEPIGVRLDRDAPNKGHPTNNPKMLLTFSADANSSTPLPSNDFYKFGIPRARLDTRHQQQLAANDELIVSLSSNSTPDLTYRSSSTTPPDVGTDLNPHREPAEAYQNIMAVDDDEDLVLDYFNFDDSPARLQFHRSVATLPSVPIKTDTDLDESGGTDIMLARDQIWLHWLVPVSVQKSSEQRGQVNRSERTKQEKHTCDYQIPQCGESFFATR